MSKTFCDWSLDQALLLPAWVHDFCVGGASCALCRDQASATIIGNLVGVSIQQRRYLGFDCLRQQRACAVAQDLSQRIGKSPWLAELQNVSVGHGVSSFDGEWRL
jgi:hypothetical protein